MIDVERQKFFWSRVGKDGNHLVWTGTKTPRAYGIITVQGREEYAHRIAWCISERLDLNEIDDYQIIRLCERNDCVETKHLARKPRKNPKKN